MSAANYLEAADKLGARLCRDALWSSELCNWLGNFMEFVDPEWQVVNHLLGPDLYSGTAGVAVFLARLFAYTGNELFRKTAYGAIRLSLSQIDKFDPAQQFGLYSGLTGVAYALTEMGALLDDESLVTQGLDFLAEIVDIDPSPTQGWDIVSGSAGVIPVLLRFHACYGEAFLLDAALRHGDLLLHAAHQSAGQSEDGWSWKTIPDSDTQNLTGFSHGTAGIAWALAELYGKSGEDRFLQAARKAISYERRWYDSLQKNWPDFRLPAENGTHLCASAWCHGAPGIGLSRLRISRLLNDSDCLAEAQIAIYTTTQGLRDALNQRTSTVAGNYSLCHGHFGNGELLIEARDLPGSPSDMAALHRLAGFALKTHHESDAPWPCGVLNGGETPNLMLGLAGIGYFFLRLHDPDNTESVLLIGPE